MHRHDAPPDARRPEAIRIVAVRGLPEIGPGDDLGALLAPRLRDLGPPLTRFDVLVIAQKVVSKAENRFLDLERVAPSAQAQELAAVTGKDPRLVEAILGEAMEVLRAKTNVIVVRHRLGYVMAQAGIDRSNVGGAERVLLLPEIKLVAQAQTLLTPAASFRERQRVTLLSGDGVYTVELLRQIAAGAGFRQFEFRFIQELGDVLAGRLQGHLESPFDSVWSDI